MQLNWWEQTCTDVLWRVTYRRQPFSKPQAENVGTVHCSDNQLIAVQLSLGRTLSNFWWCSNLTTCPYLQKRRILLWLKITRSPQRGTSVTGQVKNHEQDVTGVEVLLPPFQSLAGPE